MRVDKYSLAWDKFDVKLWWRILIHPDSPKNLKSLKKPELARFEKS